MLAYNACKVPMPDVRTCPKCQSGNIFRSRRRTLEYFLPFFRPYRCYTCERRFMMRSLPSKPGRIALDPQPTPSKHMS